LAGSLRRAPAEETPEGRRATRQKPAEINDEALAAGKKVQPPSVLGPRVGLSAFCRRTGRCLVIVIMIVRRASLMRSVVGMVGVVLMLVRMGMRMRVRTAVRMGMHAVPMPVFMRMTVRMAMLISMIVSVAVVCFIVHRTGSPIKRVA
jgi:hypothetical protein